MKQEHFRMEHIGFTHKSGIKISDFNFEASAGEVHCLFSPSNRSRTALYELLTGGISSWNGEMFYNGKNTAPHRGKHTLPLEFIQEQIELFPEMSVGENILGSEANVYSFGCLDEIKLYALAQNYLEHFGIKDIKADAKVKELAPIDRRMISILRAIANDCRILFVEDTLTGYNSEDIEKYIRLLRKVAADMVAVILVTDRLNEFVLCADHISVVRSGTVIYHTATKGLGYHQLLVLTKSKEMMYEADSGSKQAQDALFCISDNCGRFRDIKLYPSEILGIYDPDWEVGGGIYSAVQAMAADGKIKPNDLGIITEEDCLYGIFNNLSLYENISLNSAMVFDRPLGTYSSRMEYYTVKHILKTLNAEYMIDKYARLPVLPRLSHSEQMTVVIARRICAKSRAFIFINPYISFNDSTIPQFEYTLKMLSSYGYPSIIVSKNMLQLKQLCNRIEDFS